MAYEVFSRNSPRIGTASLSFGKSGTFAFNQAASRQMQAAGVQFVIVLWDSVDKKLALQVAPNADDDRAYKMRFNPKGNGASFSARPFLEWAGINYTAEKKTNISIKIVPNAEYLIEVKIPDRWFQADAPKQEAA